MEDQAINTVHLRSVGAFLLLIRLAALASADDLSSLKLPAAVNVPKLQSLLQDFVNAAYGKGFLHLGEQRDFDHGHLLLDSQGRPVAVLYHTQESPFVGPDPADQALNPLNRNWIEWYDTHKVEDARRYVRHNYPDSPYWNLFKMQRLPLLEARHTILDKMLDPDLMGKAVSDSRQWVFSRKHCSAHQEKDPLLQVMLPTKENVCLALSPY